MQSNLKQSLIVENRKFEFDLCRRKETQLGEFAIDQWWMPVTELYAQRQRKDRQHKNHRQVLNFYWAMVRKEQATNLREAQERFLLASLLPELRSQGSRKIFADAHLARGKRSERDDQIRQLDEMIRRGTDDGLTFAEFHAQSWNLLGVDEIPAGARSQYQEITRQLFDEPCDQLQNGSRGRALEAVRQKWSSFNKRYRRSGNHEEGRFVLDALSYEGRAAFHHCYSVVWAALIPQLHHLCPQTKETSIFLRFWHQDLISNATDGNGNSVSLFHGHVFGLHPGTSRFLLTTSGQQLLGNWIQNIEDVSAFQQVLNGLLISLFDYHYRRDESSDKRADSRITQGRFDVEEEDALKHERRQSGKSRIG